MTELIEIAAVSILAICLAASGVSVVSVFLKVEEEAVINCYS